MRRRRGSGRRGSGGASGLPAGVTLVGPRFSDDALVPFAAAMHAAAGSGMGIDRNAAIPAAPVSALPEGWVPIVVGGAHLTGMPLNQELTGPGGVLPGATTTAAHCKLFAWPGTVP